MNKNNSNHGGSRKGAGRPKGRKNTKPAIGRRVVTKSVSMPLEVWQKLDKQSGKLSRGKYLSILIRKETNIELDSKK